MSQVTLGQIQEDLTNRTVSHNKEIKELFRKPTETESLMSDVPGVKDKYISYTGKRGQVLQGYQPDWTPVAGESIDPMVAQVHMLKIDKEYTNLEHLFATHRADLAAEGKTMQEYPIAQWIIDGLAAQAKEEIEDNCMTAQYVTPTTGTPGPVSSAFDGALTVLQREITKGNIITTPSGSFVPADIYDNFSFFIQNLPPHLLRRMIREGQPFMMSHTNAVHLWNDYRDANNQALDYSRSIAADGSFEILIDIYRVKVKGLTSMEGSDRFLGLQKSNFKRLYDKIIDPTTFEIHTLPRTLMISALMKRGYGYDIGEEVLCNDQA